MFIFELNILIYNNLGCLLFSIIIIFKIVTFYYEFILLMFFNNLISIYNFLIDNIYVVCKYLNQEKLCIMVYAYIFQFRKNKY